MAAAEISQSLTAGRFASPPRITESCCRSLAESVRQLRGGGVRKLSGVWLRGWVASQVTVRRLNHGAALAAPGHPVLMIDCCHSRALV
jgi:hypothetical protein